MSAELQQLEALQALVPAVPSLSIAGHTRSSVLGTFVSLIIFLNISISIAVLRIGIRLKRNGKLFLNDYFLIVGAVFAVGESICTLVIFCHGVMGQHIIEVFELVPERWAPVMKFVLSAQFCWVFAVVFIKLSILQLYIQIFGGGRQFFWVAHILAFLVIVVGLVTIALISTYCIPFSAYWAPTATSHCINQAPAFLGTGIVNLGLDLLILALPMPMLLNLHMSRKKKAGISAVFGVGFGICGVSAWRVYIISNHLFADYTYPMQYMSLATSLELLIGIIIASIPIISPAFGAFAVYLTSVLSPIWSWKSSKNISSFSDSPSQALSPLSQRSLKPKPTVSQADRKNFKKLYDHLYPMSDVNNTDIRAAPLDTVVDERDYGRKGGDITITKGWDVENVRDRA